MLCSPPPSAPERDLIVSGDAHLLNLKSLQRIDIVTAADGRSAGSILAVEQSSARCDGWAQRVPDVLAQEATMDVRVTTIRPGFVAEIGGLDFPAP